MFLCKVFIPDGLPVDFPSSGVSKVFYFNELIWTVSAKYTNHIHIAKSFAGFWQCIGQERLEVEKRVFPPRSSQKRELNPNEQVRSLGTPFAPVEMTIPALG